MGRKELHTSLLCGDCERWFATERRDGHPCSALAHSQNVIDMLCISESPGQLSGVVSQVAASVGRVQDFSG